MKRVIAILLLTNFVSCSNPNRVKTGLEGKPLPIFNLLLSDSTTRLNTSRIPVGQPIVLFYFNPYCPYSKAEIADIVANMAIFRDVRFYLLTTAHYPDVMMFYNEYHLQNYSNVAVGIDYTDFFGKYFTPPGVPFIAVYDEHKHLKEALIGKMDIATLKSSVAK